MSHDSYLFGVIKLLSPVEKAFEAIHRLPANSDLDTWPFLTSEMFSYTSSPQYRDQIIHFAASYKDICGSWYDWESKFDVLISSFEYDEVKLFIEDCYVGDFVVQWTWEHKHGVKWRIKKRSKIEYLGHDSGLLM